MYVLVFTLPPVNGAAFGKAAVFDPCPERRNLHTLAYRALRKHNPHMDMGTASRYAEQITRKDTGTECVETSTGITFRIDTEDKAPNACPCCGRLVKWGDHAFAGSDDAYCDGCYTWGDDAKISCDPNHTAHANPWTTDTADARFCMEVIIDRGDETDSDYRYAITDDHEMWDDDEDNALIAWPGLTRDQIIEVTITEIDKES
jgi:hypothetical protein